MRKKAFIFCSFIAILLQGYAQPVSFEEAEQAAQHFFGKVHKSMQTCASVSVEGQDTLFYIFNADKGFVVVSGEKKAIPILAYSTENNYNAENIIPPVQMWMNYYQRQLTELRQDETSQQSVSVANSWKELATPFKQHKNTTGSSATPLLLTSRWGQGKMYNYYCPKDEKGVNSNKRAVTGCVATAMAQLMYYFRFPQSGTGSYSYTHKVYGELAADFENARYNYSSMPDRPTNINPDISLLMYHCGVAVDMEYGPDASGMYNHKAADVLKTHFKFSPQTQYVYRDKTTLDWDSLIVTHIDNRIPLYYAGWSVPDTNGHAFICDAYQIDTNGNHYYHFNFGWDGSSDGYFYTDSLSPGGNNFNLAQELIINAYPDTANFQYSSQPPLTGTTILEEETGSFTDGIYNCPPNMDYTWIIRPDVDEITTIKLNLNYNLAEGDTIFVTSLNGKIDSLFTHDTSTFLVDAADTEMTIRLKTTNDSIPSGGISGSYTTACGTFCKGSGSITRYSAKTGSFGDGSGESRYRNNSNCISTLTIDGVRSITIRFTIFETEKDRDILEIRNYAAGGVPLLMALSGSYTDSVYTFHTNSLLFDFTSDDINVDQGWELTYDTDVLGISDIEKNNTINIFPNPAQDKIQIISEETPLTAIEIINIQGQVIHRGKIDFKRNLEVDISSFSSGMYFVRLTNSMNLISIQKIILNK